MLDHLIPTDNTSEVGPDDALTDAQRLAVSAHEMLAAASYYEHHASEWLKRTEDKPFSETKTATVTSEPTAPFYGQESTRKQPEASWMIEAIGRISHIGYLMEDGRQEKLDQQG